MIITTVDRQSADNPDLAGSLILPPGMTVQYEQPGAGLIDHITGYHVYGAEGPAAMSQVDWFLPGTANIRVTQNAGPIEISIGRRTFSPLPEASLFGPTSRAIRAETNGGVMIGIGISALGWARLSRRSAEDFHNRIVPLSEAMGQEFADRLVTILSESAVSPTVKPQLDELLRPMLNLAHPDEPMIREFAALLMVEGVIDVAIAARRLGISTHSLRRIATRYFGLVPKVLLMRARFLRSLIKFMTSKDRRDYSVIDSSYHDASHFLRDSNTFLGMTPRRFLSLQRPFLDASIHVRAAVLGSATQALHDFNLARELVETSRRAE
ncbi:AraC family transcriptional regulator [Sphingomonas sp. So64.6b]|uniref:helix-turn-helix domain-containing protein n=1 Tax=Sphingomonas sp. So64.6b TaxID=2997354 RepID=UPI001601198D|nr:helix-turn-helix domain-containing protein [Sphingomonas sp. So64.6b]QNA82973.1 AraC family transcriptional regulator [Sphingomonas sp. So64.6b]